MVATRLRTALLGTRLRAPVVGLRHRGIRATDAFVASYPKSGNAWLKFMLAELVRHGEVDFESAERTIPAIGRHREAPGLLAGGGRLIKTHEPYRPEYGRAVYLIRDVRDVVVSYHHYIQWRNNTTIDLDRFVAGWVAGRADGYGPWHEHVRSWLEAEEAGAPVLILRYEELREHPVKGLGEVAGFLGIETTPSAIEESIAHNTIGRMREKEVLNRDFFLREWKAGQEPGFVRKGAVGDWRTTLSPRHLRMMEESLPTLAQLGYPAE